MDMLIDAVTVGNAPEAEALAQVVLADGVAPTRF
jgi:hypothetical protein